MKQLRIIIVLCACVIITLVQAEYPSNLPKCKALDNPCITKAANEYIEKYYGGLNDVNLLTFDPLHVKSIILERMPSSPVNVEIRLSNLDIIGLQHMKVKSFENVGDFGKRVSFEAVVPSLQLKGQYTIDGRIIILPVTGKGAVNLEAKNAHLKYSYDFKPIKKNGNTYAALEHVKLDMTPARVIFNFENLFNGDKELGDNMNKFLNDNWSDVYKELSPAFSKAISLVIKSLISSFFEKYPFEEYFV